MNDRVRTIVEEARKLTPEERRELFDLLEVEFAGERVKARPEEVEAAWLEEVRAAHCRNRSAARRHSSTPRK